MNVGVGVVDITPPVGMWMSGYGGRQGSESVIDALELRTLAWSDEETTVLIIAADLLGFDSGFVAEARAALAERYGVGPEAVLVNGSHTHGGPAFIDHLVVEAPHIDPAYRRRILDAVLETAGAALDGRCEVDLYHGWGRCRVGINRRAPEPPYSMQPNPRGFYDDTVGVLAFMRRGSRAPVAVIFNASCHPTTLGAQPTFTADWPGAARRALQTYLGPACQAVFLQGCCGNIRPRTFDLDQPTRFRQGTVAEFTRMGDACAHEVIRILHDELHPAAGELRARRVECELPLVEQPTIEELRAKAGGGDAYAKAHAEWTLARWPDGALPSTLPYEAQRLSVGEEVALLALPGEVVSELGWMARTTVATPTLMSGYSNGLPCYVPTARIQRQGGYEAGRGSNAFFGVPGWLAQETELVILDAVERVCAGG